MSVILDWTSLALLLAGSLFSVIGGIGLIRLPDFYSRMHAAGVTDTLGAGLILVGLMLQAGISLATFKLALILAFLFITSPTSAHALASAALSRGLEPLEDDAEGGTPSRN